MRSLYRFLVQELPSFWYCLLSGIKYQKGYRVKGRIRVIKRSWFNCLYFRSPNGVLQIGKGLKCNNKITSNSIGLIQPTVFNIATSGSRIVIGDNVGISGSTICAAESVTIGNNVLIGSGCIITDTDAHPINWSDRRDGNQESIRKAPVVISDDVFIGARSIILKGVTIGERTVIGAGSVVSTNIPSDCVAAGNPAKIVKQLHNES